MWMWQCDDEKFEMPAGAEIRVHVKSLHYTKRTVNGQVEETTTMSGRKRSSSLVDTSSDGDVSTCAASAMHITASICEDGLGLTDWWKNDGQDNDGGQEKEHGDEDEQFVAEGQTKEEQEADIDGAFLEGRSR
jgi:RNA polymerase III subunit Rpc25